MEDLIIKESKDPAVMRCKKCGKCCYLTILHLTKKPEDTGLRCSYLTKDNLCSVYNDRPKGCVTAEEMKRYDLLPDNCGYKEVENELVKSN